VTDAMAAGTVSLTGHGGDDIEAYLARPVDRSGFGSVVVLHHMPGYDEPSKEITRRFAARGYAALMPNLHHRDAPGASSDDAAAASRANGGVPDERLVGDVTAAVSYLKALDGANGKVGIIGYCSGGRQSFLAACTLRLDAAVDCYGGAVVRVPEGIPIKMTTVVGLAADLSCPLLGLFGEEDKSPSPDDNAELSAELDRLGKEHEFHTYRGAGHSFFSVNRPSYSPEAASEGWERIWEFYGRLLAS
jgi:carboxymethylenebutenolidase